MTAIISRPAFSSRFRPSRMRAFSNAEEKRPLVIVVPNYLAGTWPRDGAFRYRLSSRLGTGRRTPERRRPAYVRCRQLPALALSSAGQQLECFPVGRTATEFG